MHVQVNWRMSAPARCAASFAGLRYVRSDIECARGGCRQTAGLVERPSEDAAILSGSPARSGPPLAATSAGRVALSAPLASDAGGWPALSRAADQRPNEVLANHLPHRRRRDRTRRRLRKTYSDDARANDFTVQTTSQRLRPNLRRSSYEGKQAKEPRGGGMGGWFHR